MNKAVFIDRDGVINLVRSEYVKSWNEFQFTDDAFSALKKLADTDYLMIVISNQSIIGRGMVKPSVVDDIHARMKSEIEQRGGRVDAIYYCPHAPEDKCSCRKPKPGLILQAAEDFDLDLGQCLLIGDNISDVKAALSAGCRPLFVRTGHGEGLLSRLQTEGYGDTPIMLNLSEAVTYICYL